MKQIIAMTFVVGLMGSQALAEETPGSDMGEGLSLMEEGARLMMRGLIDEMEPTLDALRDNFEEMGPAFADFVQSVGPAFGELLEKVDDLQHYDAPEILPNGDIIIRRSPDAPAWVPEPEMSEDIEL